MKISFLDFWNEDHAEILKKFSRFLNLENIEIVNPNSADIIIYSVFGYENLKYNKPKIFFSGENRRRWNYNYFHDKNTKYYLTTNTFNDYPEIPFEKIKYCPHFLFCLESLKFKKNTTEKKKFCCIVVSSQDNGLGCKLRKEMFDKLCQYKKVDSCGKCFNNTGILAPRNTKEYIDFISEYKFMITFENSFGKGYVTEKIFNALCAGTIPIYWGDIKKSKEIFGTNFPYLENTVDELIQKIICLDNDNEKYNSIIQDYKFSDSFYKIKDEANVPNLGK